MSDVRPFRPRAYRPLSVLITILVIGAVVALGLVAGRWQFGRYETKAQAVEALESARDLPTIALDRATTPGEASVGDSQWRTVSIEGRFEADSLTPLRGRSVEGTPALRYLAWFDTGSGAVLVDLGWAPREENAAPALPTGQVTVSGVLREQEKDDGKRGAGATRVAAAQMPTPRELAYPGWIMARSVCAGADCWEELQPVPLPTLSLGPHLSYSMQWWLLAVVAPIIGITVLRRDARHEREARAEGVAGQGGAVRSRRVSPGKAHARRRRVESDEDVEDAL